MWSRWLHDPARIDALCWVVIAVSMVPLLYLAGSVLLLVLN